MYCQITIMFDAGVKIAFDDFVIDHEDDYLSVYDGDSSDSDLIARFTGTRKPGVVYSTGKSMTLVFTTDFSGRMTGFSITTANEASPGCKNGWKEFEKKCYKYFAVAKTWEEAESSCSNEDALLATIRSDAEQKFVASITNSSSYIGLYDGAFGWTWVGENDRLDGYSNWMDGKPEDCYQCDRAAMYSYSDFEWYDVPRTRELHYVCESDYYV